MTSTPRAQRLAGLIERRPWAIVLVALVLGVLGYFGTRRLGIDQELRALLPDDAPSVVRLDAVNERLGNQSDLYVSIRSPSREANLAFGAEIAAALEQRADIRYVLFRRDPTFFKDHGLLYAELSDLLDLRRKVIETIQDRVRRELSMFPEDRAPAADAGLDLDEKELRARYGLDTEPSEYFERDEGRLVVVRARPTAPNTDIAFARALSRELARTVESIGPQRFHPAMEIDVEGSYAEHTEHASNLERDIISGSLLAFLTLLLVVAAYFRGLRSAPLVLAPLLVAVLTALAVAWALYRELNLVSAFIFAVTLGLGIDFGTHILSRYRDELRRGLAHRAAIATAVATTGVSTAAGALSTALAFLLLVLAEFRGFSQFGVIGCLGILVAYLAALIVLPALAVLLEKIWPWRVKTSERQGPPPRSDPRTFPYLALGTLALCLGGAVAGAIALPKIGFEYNLSKLGPADRRPPEVIAREGEYRDAVGRTQSTDPTLILTDDLAQTESVHRQLQAILDLEPEEIAELTGLPPYPDTPRTERPKPAPPPPKPAPSEDEEEEDEEDVEAEDPAFVRLQALASERRGLTPEVKELLLRYPPERLREMDDLLSSVLSIYTFIPADQEAKLQVIRDIRQRIDRKRGSLSADDLEKLKTWERYLLVDRPVTIDDLPAWVKVQFTDLQGRLGLFVACWMRGPKSEYAHAKRIHDAFDTVETRSGPAPAVGSYFVVPEVVDTIRGDGPLVMCAVFGVLIATALVMFRGVFGALVVLATVGVALLWLAALFVALGWRLNLFNLVALPLLVGMGQDDSLHILHRYREEGRGMIAFVMRETGGAVTLTTVTTVIGFSSMLFVDHLGLRSLGFTAVLGMTFCLLASVTLVPASLRLREWWESRRVNPDGGAPPR